MTDEEISKLWLNHYPSANDFARAIIAARDEELRKQEPVAYTFKYQGSPEFTNNPSFIKLNTQYVYEPLYAAPIPPTVQKITLNAIQLREAIEFVNPDVNDLDQLESEVTIVERDAFTDSEGEFNPAGLYCHLTEYPEEGCIHLTGDTLSSTARPEGEKK